MTRALIVIVLAACGKGGGKRDEPGAAPPADAAAATPSRAAVTGPPLPGATATMGTNRFRPGTRLDAITFAGPDRLVGLDGRTVMAIDAATGAITKLAALDEPVGAIAVMPDGRLAIGGRDHVTYLTSDGVIAGRLDVPAGEVDTIAPTADGAQLVLSGRRGAILELDATTGAELARIDGATDGYGEARLLPGEQRLVAARDGSVVVLDRATGKEMATIAATGYWAASPDGTRIAREIEDDGTHDGTAVEVVTIDGGATTRFRAARELRALGWSADGVWVLTGDEHGQIAAWTPDGTRAWSVETGEWTLDIVPAPGGGRIAVTTTDETVRVIDVAARAVLDPGDGHVGPVTHVAFAGDRLVSAGADDTLRWWDPATGRQIAQAAVGGEPRALAVGTGGAVHVQVEHELDAPRSFADGHGSTILGAALETWSPAPERTARVELDDRLLGLTLDDDGALHAVDRGVWYTVDPTTGAVDRRSGHHRMTRGDTAIAPGGARAAFVFRGEVLLVGGASDVRLPTTHCSRAASVAIGRGGTPVAVIDATSTLRWWNPDGTLIASRRIPGGGWGSAISPGGTEAIFLAAEGLVVADLAAGGARRITIPRPSAFALSADGARIAVGLRDGRIGVWRLAELLAGSAAVEVTPGGLPADDHSCPEDDGFGAMFGISGDGERFGEPDSDVGGDLGGLLDRSK